MVFNFLRKKKVDRINAPFFSHIVSVLTFDPYTEFDSDFLKKTIFADFKDPEGLIYLFNQLGIFEELNGQLFLNMNNEIVKREIENQELIEDYIIKEMGDNIVPLNE